MDNKEDSEFNFPKISPITPNFKIINKDEAYYASAYYERLANYIIKFEEALNV